MARPLRIALAAIEYPPDPFSAGIGSYTRTLAHGLAGRGHVVHVVTRGEEERTDDEGGVVVHRLTPARPDLPENLSGLESVRFVLGAGRSEWRYRGRIARTLDALVREEGVELIEAADHMAEPVRYRPRKHPRVPFVIRMHTPLAVTERIEPTFPEPLRRVAREIERRYLLSASHLTAPGRECARTFRREMGLGNRPIATFPNPPSFDPTARASQESDPPIVLFVGRLRKWKGAHLLARAVPRIVDRVPDARFVFVGGDHLSMPGFASTGDYLRSLVPQELRPRLEFAGHVPHEELDAYYRSAAVCVLPSLFDAFPYTCLEAMTYGKAIVGSSAGGMVELLGGGEAGVLYTPPDVEELADHVVRLLREPELRRLLGARARRRVLERYRPEVVLDEIEAFYRRAIAELAA